MNVRLFVAGLLVMCCAAPGPASAKAFVKSGSLTGLPSGLTRLPSGLGVKRSFHYHGMVRRSVLLPPIVPPLGVQNFSVAPYRVSYPRSYYRRAYGDGLPAAGIGIYFGPYAVATDNDAFAAMTAEASGPALTTSYARPFDERRRCGAQTQIVPSESGGERRVTIVRC